MALKFGEGTFEQVAQCEEVQTDPEPILASMHIKLNVPKIVNREDLTKFLGQVQPLQVVFQNGEWVVVTPEKDYNSISLLKGDRFEETPFGVFELRAGERRSKLTNSKIRIVSTREVYSDDETCDTYLVCAVICNEAWGDEEKLIEVSSKNYKSVFKKIREEFRDVQLSNNIYAIDEYLSKVSQRDAKGEVVEVCSLYIGWLTTNKQTRYYLGEGDFYRNYFIPQVSEERRAEIFNAGMGFRDVGHGKM